MTKSEKDKLMLKLYSLYEKSPFGEIPLDAIKIENNSDTLQKLLFLLNEGLIIFEHKTLRGAHGEIVDVRIGSGIRFTEKGFDYVKDLKRSKLSKLWEIIYKFLVPAEVILDFLTRLFVFIRK